MATNYGIDTACISDIGLIDTLVTDPVQVVGQRIARILQTPRGGFAAVGGDPNRGWDCRQYINKKLTPSAIAVAQQQIQNECTKDEAVQSAVVTLSTAGGSLQAITIYLNGAAGPFTLVANVDSLTSDLIFTFE